MDNANDLKTSNTLGMLVIGLIALVLGSKYAVLHAREIAIMLSVSELVIGLTIVAIGTSLPELAATISAILKKKNDMVEVESSPKQELINPEKIETRTEDITDDYQPVFSNVTLLSDKDVRIVKEAFLISKKNSDYKTLNLLRKKISEILEVNSELYDIAFIDTVLKDYNY